MKIVNPILRCFLILTLIVATQSFKGDKDPLHKKKYAIRVTEMKDGKPKGKPVDDELDFKDGKVFSEFVMDKLEFKWMRYEIKKDSTYSDEGEERKFYVVEVSSTNSKDETLYINFKIDNLDIEGDMKLTKNDKPKKFYEFIGAEKAGKK